MPLLREMPGYGEFEAAYAEACRRESFNRIAGFLSPPDRICGVDVLQYTPRMELELLASGNAFVTGADPFVGDVAAFLWRISRARSEAGASKWRTRRRMNRFIRSIAGLDFFDACGRVVEYLREAHADGPPSSGGDSPAYASGTSAIVDLLAGAYGWPEEAILDVPYKRVWQYWRHIHFRKSGGDRTPFINLASDRVRAEYVGRIAPENVNEP
jgi:hypothetical protein